MTTPTPDRAHLIRAVGLLVGVGRADPADPDPGVALMCLAAADHLRPLTDSFAPVNGSSPDVALDEALANLAALSEPTFADEAVLDAAECARRARSLLT